MSTHSLFLVVRFGILATIVGGLLVEDTRRADGISARQAFALWQYLPLDNAEQRRLDSGRAIVRIDTPDEQEVLAVGAIRVRASASALVAEFRDVASFGRSQSVLAVGLISSVPTVADFAALTLDTEEVESLRRCRLDHCAFKLDAATIQGLRQRVEWGTATAHAQAQHFMRVVLAETARHYLSNGDGALTELRDHAAPVDRRAEFRTIIEHSPYLRELAPTITGRPVGRARDGEAEPAEFLYWSKADFGIKPVISLTHVTIHPQPGSCGDIVITSKQIFASHYFNASLGLTALLAADTPGEAYLLYVNRSRLDVFKGPFAGLTRAIMRRRVRGPFEHSLGLAKQRLEARALNQTQSMKRRQ